MNEPMEVRVPASTHTRSEQTKNPGVVSYELPFTPRVPHVVVVFCLFVGHHTTTPALLFKTLFIYLMILAFLGVRNTNTRAPVACVWWRALHVLLLPFVCFTSSVWERTTTAVVVWVCVYACRPPYRALAQFSIFHF